MLEEDDTMSCERCTHYKICFVHMNIKRFLDDQFRDEEKPFDVSELSAICTNFEPIMRITCEH